MQGVAINKVWQIIKVVWNPYIRWWCKSWQDGIKILIMYATELFRSRKKGKFPLTNHVIVFLQAVSRITELILTARKQKKIVFYTSSQYKSMGWYSGHSIMLRLVEYMKCSQNWNFLSIYVFLNLTNTLRYLYKYI